jgi:putative membrane protein
MVRDQQLLLGELEKIASHKNIELPKNISKSKSKMLQKLRSKSGADFDKKFMKMMKIDHKRDVKEFQAATESQDSELAAFAEKFLPLIQEHLDKIKKLLNE